MSTIATKLPVPAKGLHVGLWVAQLLLAALFIMAGWGKTFTPYAELIAAMPGLAMPEGLVRFIGVSELLGALGMILPAATRVAPILTAWAGVGLATIMVLASAFHVSRGEFSHLPVPLIALALAAFVAWGRFKAAPISPR